MNDRIKQIAKMVREIRTDFEQKMCAVERALNALTFKEDVRQKVEEEERLMGNWNLPDPLEGKTLQGVERYKKLFSMSAMSLLPDPNELSGYQKGMVTRTRTILDNAHLTTVGQLVQKTESEMLRYWTCGIGVLSLLKLALHKNGLHLGMAFDPECM